MLFDEQDISFHNLTDREFEELCFDLLLRLGYQRLNWRQGGADRGRDIEGNLTINNSLVDSYEEKWFIECKHYQKGVPVEAINSKIAWADAENPQHLVIMTSSYLSVSSKAWIEKIAPKKPYSIHIIEGKQLRALLLNFPELITRYLNKYSKLLYDAQRHWLIHDLLPEPETICILADNLDANKLSREELGFLWCSALIRDNEIAAWNENNNGALNLDHLFAYLMRACNSTTPLIAHDDDFLVTTYALGVNPSPAMLECQSWFAAPIFLNVSSRPALYSLVMITEVEGIEVLVEAAGDFPTKVRHINNAKGDYRKEIAHIFFDKK